MPNEKSAFECFSELYLIEKKYSDIEYDFLLADYVEAQVYAIPKGNSSCIELVLGYLRNANRYALDAWNVAFGDSLNDKAGKMLLFF